MLFYNGIFHSMKNEDDVFYGCEIENKKIKKIYHSESEIPEGMRGTNLGGLHVYPCLIDPHTHMLLTIAVMAMGFNVCEITPNGVEPHTIAGVEKRVREYAAKQKKSAIIALNNYILTAVDKRRMPTKEELDDWAGGRAIVIYNIDGHSTALSSKMMELVGIDPDSCSGVLQGEENERAQGRIIDKVGESIGLTSLARGIGRFHNYCAEYGINMVGALEGNGDSEKDSTTKLIIRLARHFDIKVRLYLQYTDYNRVKPFEKFMTKKRVGGCGDWEMDGASGSHSAAFRVPYKDTGKTADCYYTQEFVDKTVRRFDEAGYQIASHAIGELGVERIITALNRTKSGRLHRIEHCEFHDDAAFEELKKGRWSVVMQPGYSWIDKRYLHTYEQFLPEEIIKRMKLKSLYDSEICVCGSSDSPVQDMDPYLQMLGMVQFYNESESITPYEAMRTYTANAARAMEEDADFGTLEEGKTADFFTATEDFFRLKPSEIPAFRPVQTYYGGKAYRKKKGNLAEFVCMLLHPAKQI